MTDIRPQRSSFSIRQHTRKPPAPPSVRIGRTFAALQGQWLANFTDRPDQALGAYVGGPGASNTESPSPAVSMRPARQEMLFSHRRLAGSGPARRPRGGLCPTLHTPGRQRSGASAAFRRAWAHVGTAHRRWKPLCSPPPLQAQGGRCPGPPVGGRRGGR